jgi:rare lipoprotein A
LRLLLLFFVAFSLAGCSSAPQRTEPPRRTDLPPRVEPSVPETKAPPSTKGGYYKDDGPGENPPPDLASVPDAVPRAEPLHRYANRRYQVFGKEYVPISSHQPYRERGTASWYGKKFHGQKTSSGEVYDMYKMSAAHKTLPIPSYARVTNLANGKSVVVRINDRGPFHSDRIIDLSYAAAHKLDYIKTGSAKVQVESIDPGEEAGAQAQVAAAPAEEAKNPIEAKSPVETRSAVEAKGTYIQVGAFQSRGNAEAFRERVTRQLTWLTDGIQVLSIGNLWRLHVGPYGSSEAARAIAERIEAELKLKPLVVTR